MINGRLYIKLGLMLLIGILLLSYGGFCDKYKLTKSGSSGEQPKPNAPAGLVARAIADSQVDLTWTDTATVETGFTLERSGDGVIYALLSEFPADTTAHSDTTVTAGNAYYYRVKASNPTGESSYSEIAAVSPLSAPSVISATGVAVSQINIAWTDNSNNEDGFLIERKLVSATDWTAVGNVAGANINTYSDSNLIDGAGYNYRVRAYNWSGESSWSTDGTGATLLAGPSALNTFVISSSQIDLAWQDNSASEDGFKIERKDGLTGAYTPLTTIAGANISSYSDTTLSDGRTYYYQVRAYNSLGESDWSNEASPAIALNAPTQPLATVVSSSRIDLSWTDNSANESCFEIERAPASGGVWATIFTTTANATSYSDTGLTDSTVYYYRIRAYNADVLGSSYTDEASGRTPPNAPSGLQATAVSSTRIDLAWQDNSGAETGFKIERAPAVAGQAGAYEQIITTTANTTVYTDTGLTDGTMYYYRVRSYDEAGDSAWSSEANAATIINAPTDLAGAVLSPTQTRLNWIDNSSSETGFKVERSTDNLNYGLCATLPANSTVHTDTNIADGQRFYYRVMAYNAAVNSAYTGVVTLTTPLNSPTPLSATAFSFYRIDLAWPDNSANETSYQLERKTGINGVYAVLASLPANTTGYINTGVSPGANYYYRIKALNSTIASAYSNEVTCAGALSNAGGGTWKYYRPITITNSGPTINNYAAPVVPFSDPAFIDHTGLMASWHFSGNNTDITQDMSGNNYLGLISGAPSVTSGRFGQGISFDGADDGVTVADHTNLRLNGDFSIEFWYKLTAMTGTAPGIIYKGDAATADGFQINYDATGKITFKRNNIEASSTAAVVTTNWRHYAFSYASGSGNWVWYADGASSNNGTNIFPANNGAADLVLGRGQEYGQGVLDELKIYSRTLTGAEVLNRYNYKVQHDYADLRFINAGLDQEFSYYQEADNLFWVKVPVLTGTADTVIKMLYGNPTATAVSSLSNTFAFGDDFAGATINTGKWIESDSSRNALRSNDRLELWNTAFPTWDAGLFSAGTASNRETGLTLVGRFIPTAAAAQHWVVIGWGDDQSTETVPAKIRHGIYFYQGTIRIWEAGSFYPGLVTPTYTANTIWDFRIRLKATGCDYEIKGGAYSNWTTMYNGTGGGYNTSPLRVTLSQFNHSGYLMDIYVNKEASPAPVVAAPGSQYRMNVTANIATSIAAANQVDLSWDDTTPETESFRIERSEDQTNWAPIGTTSSTSYSDTTAVPNTTYYYRIVAYTAAGDDPYASVVETRTAPPDPPINLIATAVSTNSISLQWEDRANNEVDLRVERSPDSTNWTMIAALPANSSAHTDSTVTEGTLNYYRIKASNALGFNYSGVLAVTAPPNAPNSLAAVTASSSALNLTWQDNSNNESGYKVERRLSAGDWNQIAALPAGTTAYASTGLAGETTYYYRVRAYVTGADSAYSNEASAMTAPNAPSGLVAAGISTSQITITWTDNSDIEETFKIERKTAVTEWAQVGTVGPNIRTYPDSGLTVETTYYYRVRAYKAGLGNSAYSSEASAATAPNAPSALTATALSASQITLTWADNSLGETGFKIERKTGEAGAYTQIATVGAGVTTYNNTGLIMETTYYYRIRAYSAGGNSDYSNEASAETLGSVWSKVACGGNHTLGIKGDVTFWSWGYNEYGQLGLGVITHYSPAPVGTATNWQSVASGYDFTLAVKTNGTLWAWGYNSDGQLGLGDTNKRYSPVQVGTDTNWQSVSSGYDFTIAVKTDGTLWAWGDNYDSQLGLGDTTDRNSPVQVGTGTNWQSVSSGYDFTVAVKTDGTLWAWGDNYDGQLGLGDTTDRNSPTPVGADTNWQSVACGNDFTVAVKTDGTLWAWGDNYDGQLGLGDTTDRNSPVQVGGSTAFTDESGKTWTAYGNAQLDAVNKEFGTASGLFDGAGDYISTPDSTDFSLGTGDFTIDFWAKRNSFGTRQHICGQCTSAGSYITDNVEFIENNTIRLRYYNGSINVEYSSTTAVTDTNWHHYAVVRDGNTIRIFIDGVASGTGDCTGSTVYDSAEPFVIGRIGSYAVEYFNGWIDEFRFSKGIARWTSNFTPPAEEYQADATAKALLHFNRIDANWQSVACGNDFTLAVKTDGTLWAWGSNWYGQLGDGTTATKYVPTQIAGTTWSDIAAGDGYSGHTVALKTDGTLWTWGYNGSGQLGLGDTTNRNSPVQVGTAANWLQPAGGSSHTVAVTTDGTLWGWGENYDGQLGLGEITDRYSPAQVGIELNWQAIAGGSTHTLAIKTNDTLWAWGNNGSGRLGLGDTTTRYSPAPVGTATNWKQAAGGDSHTVAIKTDGTLWSCGYNYDGQLGLGTSDWNSHPTPTQVGTATNWKQVACGYNFTVAVKTDGTLWAWGDNYNGQLGLGDTTDRYSPTPVGTGTTWSAIAAGDGYSGHTVALKTDGTLWTWGYNGSGQLGDGTTANKNVPTQIAGTTWSDIAAGGAHTVALKTDGSLWAWGQNYYGQLGLGDTSSRSSPVQVGTVTNWSPVACGSSHTIAIKTDGSLWAWGRNNYGQLGLGDTTDRNSPAQVGVPPEAPSGLSATPAGSQINLAWTDNSGNENEFSIERKTGAGGTYAEIATRSTDITSYSDTATSEYTTYYYRVRASNPFGYSAYSNEVSAGTTLNAPSALVATLVTNTEIALVWTDNSAAEDGYKVERKIGVGGTYGEIAALGPGSTAYTNTGLAGGTTYYYRLRAFKGTDYSAYSNVASAGTPSGSLANAVDDTSHTWTTGGDAGWFSQSIITNDGSDAAQSGDIADSQTSWLQTTVIGRGTLTFWWRVSSESGYDYLKFYIDDVEKFSISGTTDGWAQITYTISTGGPAAAHILKWVYSKDSVVSSGDDCGWLDQFTWTPQ